MTTSPSSSAPLRTRIESIATVELMVQMLRTLFEREKEMRESLEKLSLENPSYQSILSVQQKQMAEWMELIQEQLQTFLNFPPCHVRHTSKLEAFHRSASYIESVFIMTKFPDGSDAKDVELNRVINSVAKSITDCGFYPRIASDYDYHPLLWDNVELYLLGCNRGVAIVEDHYKPELNPNVALEWGWMRGMGKDVLYLVENDFKHFRADWSGLTKYSFSWDSPEAEIDTAIKKWLKSKP